MSPEKLLLPTAMQVADAAGYLWALDDSALHHGGVVVSLTALQNLWSSLRILRELQEKVDNEEPAEEGDNEEPEEEGDDT